MFLSVLGTGTGHNLENFEASYFFVISSYANCNPAFVFAERSMPTHTTTNRCCLSPMSLLTEGKLVRLLKRLVKFSFFVLALLS